MSQEDVVLKTLLDINRQVGELAGATKLMHDDLKAHIKKDEDYQAGLDARCQTIELKATKEKWMTRALVGVSGGAFYKGVELLSTLFFGGHHK